MKNYVSKFLMLIFLIQIFTQMGLVANVNPNNNPLSPNKGPSISSLQNGEQLNNVGNQTNQSSNNTSSQNIQANTGNTNSSSSGTSIQAVQSTQSITSTTSNPPASIDNYKYKENITIDRSQFGSSVYNYPLLLKISSDTNLATHANQNGSDIAFFGTDGSLYSYSIISYSTGNLQSWVNIPYVSSSVDTVFYMAYGNQSLNSYQNSTAVWNSNYNTVLHLNETSGTTVYDSTANGNNGQRYSTSDTPGVVDNGQSFTGSTGSYITDPANPTGSVTIGFWFKLTNYFSRYSNPISSVVLLTKYIDDSNDMQLIIRGTDYQNAPSGSGTGSLILKVENNNAYNYKATSSRSWSSNTWYYVVVVINAQNGANQIYINGQSQYTYSAGTGYGGLPSTNFKLGGGGVDSVNLAVSSSNYLNGAMDEFWVMGGVQTSSFISATYNNMYNPSSFVKSVGTQEYNYPTIDQVSTVLAVNDSLQNGHPVLWAKLNDGWHHPTTIVTMKINSSISNDNYNMTFNGTMWVLTSFLPQYDTFYNYQVINATDGYGHYLPLASVMNAYNFSHDKVAPTVLDYGYSPTETANGTFWAKVTDSWGILANVTLNVTQCDCKVPVGTSVVTQMVNNGTMFYVNWLIMGSDVNINFNITAKDIAGNTFTTPSSFSYVANKAPWVTNVILNSTSFTANDNLYVNYTYHDYDNNIESGTYFNWYKNGILQPNFNNTNVIDKSNLLYGENWSVVVFPSDGVTYGSPVATQNVTIQVAVPLVNSLTITSNPKTLDNLTVNWAFYDADNLNMIGYNVTWYVNGVYNSTYQNMTTIYHGFTNESQIWKAVIQVYNGYKYSANYSISVTILDTAPVISNVGFNVSSPYSSSQPFAISYSYFDADNQSENISLRTIRWYINGTLNSSLNDVAQFNSANYTGFWNYFLTVSDGQLSSSTVLSGTLTVGTVVTNTLPVASYVNITSTDYKVSSNLYLNYTYYDKDGNLQSGTKIYWYKNGYLQPNLNESTVVSNTLLASGNIWMAIVIPSDGIGLGNATDSNNVTILNSPPLANSISISPSIYTTSNISASFVAYDANNDPLNATITWYRNVYNSGTWAMQSQYNKTIQISSSILSPTITFQVNSSSTSRLDTWYYTIQLFDGSNYSQTYQSANVSILNSIPTITGLSFNQTTNIRTNDTIKALASFNDIDSDSLVNYTITWFKNGIQDVNYTGGSTFSTGFYLFSNMTTKGEYWTYKLQVSDGFNNSLIYSPSQPIQIINTPPTVTGLSITPMNPLVTTSLTVSYTYFDIDNYYNSQIDVQSGTLIYWYKNNILQSYLTNSLTVSKSLLTKGENWTVTVIPSDGSSYGSNYTAWVVIGNSPPVVSQVSIQNNLGSSSFYTTNNLIATYTVSDADVHDTVVSYTIKWYSDGVYNSNFDNNKTILSQYTTKGEVWNFTIQVSDGTDVSSIQSSGNITILDSAPILTNYNFNQTSNITSLSNLKIVYNYTDADGDIVSNYLANFSIRWYLFQGGNYVNQKNGSLYLFANETTKGEYWYYTIQVFDGQLYSNVETSPVILIGDTVPVITSLNISSTDITANGYLKIHYTYYDADSQDSISQLFIRWYMNDTLQPSLNNTQTVDSTYLKRGQVWYYTLQISDGFIDPNTNLLVWSSLNTSSTITIANFIPVISNAGFVSSQYQSQNFIVQDQSLSLKYTFYDADNDLNQSIVHWYKDNNPMPQFDNLTTIPASNIQANQTWYYNVTPYDGINTGKSVISSTEFVESKANISTYGVTYSTDQEGNFIFWANVTDLLHENTLSVQFYVKLENLTGFSINANNNGTDWTGQYSFTNLANFPNYLNTSMNISITAQTKVGLVSITSDKSFTSNIIDNSPPRVTSVNYIFNNPNNPTNITFNADIQEYGSGVKSVYLYYDFETIQSNTSSTLSSSSAFSYKLSQNAAYTKVQMTAYNSTFYTVTVPVDFKANTYILYRVQTEDNADNINQNAFPQGLNKNRPDAIFTFNPNTGGGIPTELVAGIVAVVLIVALLFTFVGIKKFRSTELVGLDKDLVIAKIKDIKNDNEVITQLDLHTLGIITSFFDQRHGPIPIIVTPEILQDNYNLLVDLSDMSFSSARFSGNFEDEIYSTYNFNPGPGQFINIISFGFALDRPDARGGAENITLNILLHKNVSELINQFIDQFHDRIHEIHVLMDKHGGDKEAITQKIKELRIFLSKIVITYEKLYGTTELLDSYDQLFDN